jgi:hypothetical protein
MDGTIPHSLRRRDVRKGLYRLLQPKIPRYRGETPYLAEATAGMPLLYRYCKNEKRPAVHASLQAVNSFYPPHGRSSSERALPCSALRRVSLVRIGYSKLPAGRPETRYRLATDTQRTRGGIDGRHGDFTARLREQVGTALIELSLGPYHSGER